MFMINRVHKFPDDAGDGGWDQEISRLKNKGNREGCPFPVISGTFTDR